ncbi:MAG: VC0807 family protein [Opitutales bacterium]
MKKAKKENTLFNIIFNIAIPSVLLIWGGKFLKNKGIESILGLDASVLIFVLALAFPIIYGIYDLVSRKKWNVISIIGVISVFLTGGIGLMQLSREWIIAKEGLVPLVLGVIVLISSFTKKPLIKALVYNDAVLNIEKLEAKLIENNNMDAFNSEFKKINYIFAFSFLLSAILNFALASYIFTANSSQEEFNEQVGKMTALSYPVIVLPTTIIMLFATFKIFKAIKKYSNLGFEELLNTD